MFSMFVPDLMHDFELGAWRALFIYILRILDSVDAKLLTEVDRRYVSPTFCSTDQFNDGHEKVQRNLGIWKGRDSPVSREHQRYEAIDPCCSRMWLIELQCAIPVFDGLLPKPHNHRILQLLFVMAHWHALAKLRLHTETTLSIMDHATIMLGDKLRTFQQKTCSAFQTRELQREKNARVRRQVKKSKQKDGLSGKIVITDAKQVGTPQARPGSKMTSFVQQSSSHKGMVNFRTEENSLNLKSTPSGDAHCDAAQRPKVLNLNTYKWHALGDYTSAIRQFGTMDSYSTEIVSVIHRIIPIT